MNGLKKLRETDSIRTMTAGNIAMTAGGAELYRSNSSKPPPTIHCNEDFHRLMKGLVNSRPCCEMFDILSSRGTMTRKELADETGNKVFNGGSFGMNLKALENHSIIEYPGPGLVRFTNLMFPFGNETCKGNAS